MNLNMFNGQNQNVNQQKKPSYNVRIPPPKTRFGWLGGFLYRMKKNKELHIARLYGLGGFAGIVALAVGVREMAKRDREKLRTLSLETKNADNDNNTAEKDHNDSTDMPSFAPDYIVRGAGGQGPEIRISEKDDCVEAAFGLGFADLRVTTKVPLNACQFDDSGNIVLDERGFPLLIGQRKIRDVWRDRFDNIKSKFQSFREKK